MASRPYKKRRHLTTDERNWAIGEMHSGARKASDLARELGTSKSTLNNIYQKFRQDGSTASGKEITPYYDDVSPQQELSDSEDLNLLQKLEPIETWIEETKTQLSRLQRDFAGQFAWDNLTSMLNKFSHTVYAMRVVEIRRVRTLLEKLDDLDEDICTFDAFLSNFEVDMERYATSGPKRERSPDDGEYQPAVRLRVNAPTNGGGAFSSAPKPADSPQQV
ncbi:hypothetical protein OPT61_g5092 [Boeremia exigua]|uniref:Uncharacterized protein n=1 Tax=Boeremia exigua TaxID=749465 RepID=A0ACC2IBI6_9PLEO|nr:hypothetical protein OPT61_g5092 [Boeremia exigua]